MDKRPFIGKETNGNKKVLKPLNDISILGLMRSGCKLSQNTICAGQADGLQSVSLGGTDNMSDATAMLVAIQAGDSKAAEALLALVYNELRWLASSKLAQEAPNQTLQPTELVHEAWLRLVGDRTPSFNDRQHFFRASAQSMRRILIDRARRKARHRHGGSYQRVDFQGFDLAAPMVGDQMLALDEALEKFAAIYPIQAELVNLRYFVGLTNEEVSKVMGISTSTAKNYWVFSRAWLLHEIENA